MVKLFNIYCENVMKFMSNRILVVDDNKKTLRDLISELKHEEPRWEFLTAFDDSEATEILQRELATGQPVAVVITDLHIKNDEQGGIQLIHKLAKIDPLAMSILYTGYPELLRKYDTSSLGAVDIVVKAEKGKGDPVQRILEKTRAALRYRSWAVRINYFRRYFDSRFFDTIENDPSLLEPKNRELTIAFWDIRGFSDVCDKLREDPELIAGFLKGYCELAARTIFKSGGILDKFIGDGVMALFGVLDQREEGQRDAALAAVRAAKALQTGFPELVKQWMPKWERRTTKDIDIGLGCGIHTGRAVVGNMGTDFRDQFTAVGPHVNFAQRLESLAGKADGKEILISQPTASYLKGEGEVRITFFKYITNVKSIPGRHKVFAVDS